MAAPELWRSLFRQEHKDTGNLIFRTLLELWKFIRNRNFTKNFSGDRQIVAPRIANSAMVHINFT
jgi:hypothetical protein